MSKLKALESDVMVMKIDLQSIKDNSIDRHNNYNKIMAEHATEYNELVKENSKLHSELITIKIEQVAHASEFRQFTEALKDFKSLSETVTDIKKALDKYSQRDSFIIATCKALFTILQFIAAIGLFKFIGL